MGDSSPRGQADAPVFLVCRRNEHGKGDQSMLNSLSLIVNVQFLWRVDRFLHLSGGQSLWL